MNKKAEFVGYTVGLNCRLKGGRNWILVKAEFERNGDGSVTIKAVSARNLAAVGGIAAVTVSADAWDDRPRDPYDDTREAVWALKLLGFSFE